LHLRASGWYEDNGLVAEAVGHALSASDLDSGRAARLVELGIKDAWSRGEFPTVLGWLEALPTEAKRLRPTLFLEHALALVLTGRPGDVEALLEEAERAAEATGEDRRFLLGIASAVRSWRARLRGDASEAVELARRALSLLPNEDAPQRMVAAVCLGDALRTIGDLSAASEALAEAADIGRSAGHVYGTLTGMVWQARVLAERGRLREADDAFRRALRFVAERRAELLPAAGLAHIGMGALLYERNELEEAERELERGVDLAERTREVSNLVWGYVMLSKAKRARGEEEGALEAALEAERIARNAGADLQIAIAANWMTRLRLARGDLAGTGTFEQERATGANAAAGAAWVIDRTTSVRLHYARGRHGEALRRLEELGEAAAETGRTGDLIEVLTLQGLALWARNEKERAVSTLTRALTLAEPEGYVRTFVDEGAPMGDLLSATLAARQRSRPDDSAYRVSTRYLANLLAAVVQGTETSGADGRLAEPLSGRELEVLAFIAAGEPNARIAGKLFVTTSTVKTHINNLYRKLGARSRTQAVARAREMDLL
jgi:LuxR family maltose regulon positive regulatory protein